MKKFLEKILYPFSFLAYPFIWLYKIIKEYYIKEKQREHELKLQANQLKHDTEIKDKDNEIRKYEANEKTKRLEIVEINKLELARIEFNKKNPEVIQTLCILRKTRKGKKTTK